MPSSERFTARELGIGDDFVRFNTDGTMAVRYFGSDFQGSWTIDDDGITRTDEFSEPVHYRLSDDGQTLLFDDFDEEHAREMIVEYERE